MTIDQVLNELKSYASEQTRNILMKHGAPQNTLGVKVGDMKKIQKKVKKDQGLALELYASGIPDAMYLAGLIADENQVDMAMLDKWVQNSNWQTLYEYTVPWLAADSGLGVQAGLEWIKSDHEGIASAGWSALSSALSVAKDDDLDMEMFKDLLDSIPGRIGQAPGRVKYTMNGFVIAAGCFVEALNAKATTVANKIGKLEIDINGTACKVPYAPDYIKKVLDKGYLGKKKKMARC
ncbi:MAG: DNA alkylation repair protein [Saprospiraceae bacterium]|jgi:hypothetical protein